MVLTIILPNHLTQRELLARIRVLTRSEKQQDNVITLGNISLNTTTCELSSPSGSFLLTNKEYQMMLMFMNNKTQVISAEHFMEKIWDSESDSDISTVWTYISYLRRKLEALKSDYSIATRRNMGYYLKITTNIKKVYNVKNNKASTYNEKMLTRLRIQFIVLSMAVVIIMQGFIVYTSVRNIQ